MRSATTPQDAARVQAFARGFRRLRAATSPEAVPDNPHAAAVVADEQFAQQRLLYTLLPEPVKRLAWAITSIEQVA